jgi:hypothetical protein
MYRDSLHHIPSRHSVQFDHEGNVTLSADCDCSVLPIRRGQNAELWQAVREWQVSYWRPLQINREFASHFRERSVIRRFLIQLTGRMHHALASRTAFDFDHHPDSPVQTPAE